jgi:hypothetical protein
MPAHALMVHPDVDAWVRERPDLRRRIDWLLFELTTRGEAGRSKGVIGPAARVVDQPDARWRRSGVGGFHYYAWWFPTGGAGAPVDNGVAVRAVRHHDEMRPLAAGDLQAYVPRRFGDLEPLTEEQERIVRSPARVRLVVGQPGTGKTGALIFAAIQEAISLPPDAQLLYVTLSRRLADLAQEIMDGVERLDRRVRVVPFADLVAEWSGQASETAASDKDEERAFLRFAAGFAPRDLAVWGDSARALWAEVRAQALGRALPFSLRDLAASGGPIVDESTYRRMREPLIGAKAARAAWRAARLFVERRDLPSVQREAWLALERLRAGKLDPALAPLGGLIVDEIQDLTLLQIAVLVEATRRIGELRNATTWSVQGERSGRPYDAAAPLFMAAGDESQIVHPSGFDWGRCKDLLFDRLGTQPDEVSLRTSQRSAAPLVEVTNRTVLLYDELPREYRPRGSSHAEKTDAANGEVVLATADSGDDLIGWLDALADAPHTAIVVGEHATRDILAPGGDGERFRDLTFTAGQIKGLDRQYVVVWDASRALARLRDEIESAHNRTHRPRYLVARTAIDELRVAVSRATETLVFLDPPDATRDPLLAELATSGLAHQQSIRFLRARLEERNADPRERARGFLEDAADLLDEDLDRALRTLVRVEAALAGLVDPEQRRDLLERGIEVRRRAAYALIQHHRFEEAAEQFDRLERVGRELGDETQARQYQILGSRYRLAPPGSDTVATELPGLLLTYLTALEALPAHQRSPRLYTLPRDWLAEATAARPTNARQLRHLADSARRLADLSGEDRDRRASQAASRALADALLATGAWADALTILTAQPTPPPEKVARCHEGLKAWRPAAEARLAAGQPIEALANYRRAGRFSEAAALAHQLDQPELASTLATLGELTAQLEHLQKADLTALTEDETNELARHLRTAADHLRRRPKR